MIVMQACSSRSHVWRRRLFLCSCALLLVPVLVGALYGVPQFPEGPAEEMYRVSRELIERGSFLPESFARQRELLVQESRAQGVLMWQDIFSRRANGELFPKHSFVASLFATPFLWLIGDWGVALGNVLVLALLVCSIHSIVRRLSPLASPFTTLASTLLGSQMIFYTGGIAYDSLGALMVVGGLALALSGSALGGFWVAASALVRPTNILYLPCFLCGCRSRREGVAFLAGSVAGLGVVALVNLYLWGGVAVTAYHRVPWYNNGIEELRFDSTFSLSELASNWGVKLFGRVQGVLLFNPLLFLLPYALWRARGSRLGLVLGGTFIAQSLVAFAYSGWSATWGGNRYLMPAISCAIALCVAYLPRRAVRALPERASGT